MKTSITTYLPQEVLIVENDRILSIPFVEIETITCDKPYILIETTNKKYHLAQNLNGFCTGLPSYIIQCNKSTYINLLQVTSIQKNRSGYEAFIQGTPYSVARRRASIIKENFIKIKTEITTTELCYICTNCKATVGHAILDR